jgi:hypothetical protein
MFSANRCGESRASALPVRSRLMTWTTIQFICMGSHRQTHGSAQARDIEFCRRPRRGEPAD